MSKKHVVETLAAVAAFFDVSPRTVEKWSTSGMPGGRGSYDTGQIARWLFTIGPWRSEVARKDVILSAIEGRGELAD